MERRSALVALVLITVLVSVGGAAILSSSVQLSGLSDSRNPPDTQDGSSDPPQDVIGWESGYWHNESIDINQSDGLSQTELDSLMARSKARVEEIRQLEFTESVAIEFVDRAELSPPRNDTYGLSTASQLWEALFIYGEETNTERSVQNAQRSSVLGYAAEEGSDRIVIVDSNPDRPTVSGETLIHELAHMLQDQQFDLEHQRYQRSSFDGEFAKDGLVEGEATLITSQYYTHCSDGWECIDKPPRSGGGAATPGPARFHRLTYFPYSTGEQYVQTLHREGGWDRVNTAHENPPVSTEQVIHPMRTEEPKPLSVSETARNGWEPTRRETVGEAGIRSLLTESSNVNGSPSMGWGNDTLITYTKQNASEDEQGQGYVWKTVWDSEKDAKQFSNGYVSRLEDHSAVREGNSWRIEDGAFADSFGVYRNGTTVTIVNGPTDDSLAAIRPNLSEQPNERIAVQQSRLGGQSSGPATAVVTLLALFMVVAIAASLLVLSRG